MKNLLLLILFFIVCSTAKSQMPTNNDYTNWNWEDSSEENWKREKNGVWSTISSPFNSSIDRVNLIYEVNKNQDFTYQKGWRLVHANFRGSFPYFVLYNINNSLLRGFIFIEGDAGLPYSNSIVMTITPNSNLKNTKLFHLGEPLQYAVNDKSPESVFSQNSLSATTTAGLNSWTALEIPLLFDPTMTSLTTDWTIEFFSGSISNFSMSINGTSVPMDANGNLLFSHPVKSSNAINTDAFSKIHTQIKNISDWGDKLQSNADKITVKEDTPGFLKKYKTLTEKLSKTLKTAGAISQISSGLEVALGVFNFFLGGSSNTSIPSGYSHSFNGEGSISSLLFLRANTLSVPGSNNANLPSWAYDCPLGVINLTNTPTAKKTNGYYSYPNVYKYRPTSLGKKYSQGYKVVKNSLGVYNLYYVEGEYNLIKGDVTKEYSCTFTNGSIGRILYSYKLYSNIDLDIKSGINITEAKFALLGKTSNEDNLMKKSFVNLYQHKTNMLDNTLIAGIDNPIYTNLENETYSLYEYDKNNKIFIFGTPYVNIDQLKSLHFEIVNGVDVYLGVQIKYTISGDNAARYFKGTYKINTQEEKVAQDILIENDKVSANFLTNPYPAQCRINYFTYNCDNNILLRSSNILYENIIENEAYLTPNPTNGILTFNDGDTDANCNIDVYTISGRCIFSKEKILNGESIDLSSLPKGVYIAKMMIDNVLKTEKIVLK